MPAPLGSKLEGNVVRTYIEMSMNYALLDIAKATLQQQQQIADLATRRLKGGIGTQLEVSQAETPIPNTHVRSTRSKSRSHSAVISWPRWPAKVPGAGDSIQRPTLALDAARGSAKRTAGRSDRPSAGRRRGALDVRAGARHRRRQANSIGHQPAGVDWRLRAMGPLFQFLKNPSHSWSAGPALSLPIFDGGRLRSQLGAAVGGLRRSG